MAKEMVEADLTLMKSKKILSSRPGFILAE
jgi:hypothetical protein